ncbi:hypothetical protein V5O48_014377 [Marasmius crinis-equi]|uniref:Uncharacterized protein n=1 Tax=Marasmius crinis-equi TaxID=585013 RepID=A0ABR3EXH5_9AGAR
MAIRTVGVKKDHLAPPNDHNSMLVQYQVHIPKSAELKKNAKKGKSKEAGPIPLTAADREKKRRKRAGKAYGIKLDNKQLKAVMVKYVEIHDEDKREKIKRPTMKSKMSQVASGLKQIIGILQALKLGVSIEAMVLMTRNRLEAFMKPKWFMTDPHIHGFMKFLLRGWDPAFVGIRFEAFAVAGCDVIKVLKSQKDQAEQLKKWTVELVQIALDEACGTKNQKMHYVDFDKQITVNHKLVIEGWPKGIIFQCPSSFGGSLEPLYWVYNAWQDGVICFRKLSDAEFREWEEKRAADIESGEVVVKQRKKRSDAGVSRKGKGKQPPAEDEEEDVEDQGSDKEAEQAVETLKGSQRTVENKSRSDKKKTTKKAQTQPSPASRPSQPFPDTSEDSSSVQPESTIASSRPRPRRVVKHSVLSQAPVATNAVDEDEVAPNTSGPVIPTDLVPSPTSVPVPNPVAVDETPTPSRVDEYPSPPHVRFNDELINPTLRGDNSADGTIQPERSPSPRIEPPKQPLLEPPSTYAHCHNLCYQAPRLGCGDSGGHEKA